MKNIDYLSLNGHSLRIFLTVLEEKSVSRAAEHLRVTQSAVSHSLDKLRIIFNDPLFIRSGRGIEATERAIALREPIQSALDSMKKLLDARTFDPKVDTLDFTIAANDFQRNLFFPPLLQQLRKEGVQTQCHFIPSGIPNADILRQDKCNLIITPFPPKGSDIYQLKLFDDHSVCFYDGKVSQAPKTWKEFSERDLVEVNFSDQQSSLNILPRRNISQLKKPVISVPNFGAIESFIKGTNMITVAISLMKTVEFKELDSAPVPFKGRKFSMYMAWHRRDHNDPAHQWFREQIQLMTKQIVSKASE